MVVLSGSVALLADTVHNLGDALTAVPLAAAFILGRRPATRSLTGYGRAEDLAGLAVLALILFSAIFAAYEAINRFFHPSTPGYLLAVTLAGLIGFAGNEWVAVYRIRSGRRIGSRGPPWSPTVTTPGSTASRAWPSSSARRAWPSAIPWRIREGPLGGDA